MSDTRTIKSFWWSPDKPATRCFGILTIEAKETPSLQLFVERCESSQNVEPVGNVIHGMDEHGKSITLLYVGSAGETISGAVTKRECSAGYALIGIAIPNPDSFVAHSLRFQLQHLYGWLGRSGFEMDTDRSRTFTTHYTHPADEVFAITPDLELVLHSTFETHNGFQERRIREDAALTFRSKAGLSLTRCKELIDCLRTLLHFAVLKRVYPTWITAYKNGHGYEVAGQWIDQDIGIWSSILHEAKSEPPLPDRWLFRFEDVQQDFAGFIRDWLEYEEQFSEPLGCYASTIYLSPTSEMTLLALTQALDAYHGIKFQSHDERDFKIKTQQLLDAQAIPLRGLVDDTVDFAERVHATRNYYTHHNPDWLNNGKVATRVDLIRMNEKLRLLFQMAIDADLRTRPVSHEEESFVTTLILHLGNVYRAMKNGEFVTLEGLQKDVKDFFSLPIPKAVWGRIKGYQDQKFVNFLENAVKT